ncbi:MAG: hypothetical protein ACYCYM_06240, partial [Saccharofermentanales bacterium]
TFHGSSNPIDFSNMLTKLNTCSNLLTSLKQIIPLFHGIKQRAGKIVVGSCWVMIVILEF